MYYSDEQTERELARLEKSIKREYTQAYKELKKKTDDYFASFAVRDARMKADIESGKYPIPAGYTPDQYYKIWRQNQLGRGKRWEKMRDDMAKRIGKSNQIAASYINDTTPGIYSLNHNYEAYQIESITGAAFDIYNEQTVKQLVKGENHTEFRTVSVNPIRDYKWNTQKINTALTSGILQGKSIKNLTDSFMVVMQNNRTAAIRNARTAVTSAQNSGRQECYNRAVEKGIELEKEWMATNDSRTRDSHKHLDGVIVKYNEPFPNNLMYPGDPDGEPAEVYNCRCTMTARLPKYSDYSLAKGSRTGNDAASYKKWVNDKKNTEKSSEKNGKNSIIIAKSLGAKARNYDVSMPDGSITHFTEGTRIENIKTIAGKGRNRQIDMVDVLVDNYGGSASEWQKKKGLAYIDLEDESVKCEVHWYEEPTAGRHDFKVKPHNGEIEYHE